MPGKTSKIKLDGAFAKRDLANRRSGLLPGGWWLWCLIGLALGLGVWIGGRRYLRNELSWRLTSAESSQETLASIDALLSLDGDAAIDVSRALAHPDFIVAHTAFRALNEQLDAWEQLESTERIKRVAQLVSELDRVPAGCDQDHRILVTGLASRLYAEALSSRDPLAVELLDRCKRILDRKASATLDSSSASLISSLAADEALAPIESSLNRSELYNAPPAPLPPIESANLRAAAPFNDSPRADGSTSARSEPSQPLAQDSMPRLSSRTGRTDPGSDAARIHLTGTPSRRATLVDRPAAMSLSDSNSPQPPQSPQSSRSHILPLQETSSEDAYDQKLHAAQPFDASGINEPVNIDDAARDVAKIDVPNQDMDRDANGGEDEETLAGIEDLPIDQLVRLLSSLQPRVTQAAALALRRKGMNDDKLDLAMQLAVGSSAQRKDVLQSLGGRSDLDPRPWLLWMAADGDEAVREQAVGMLGSLLDQDVRRQLRLLLNKERDERVAQTIRRVLAQ